MPAFHANIKGMVQGVGFRYFTQRAASRLGLTGWVRNMPDGTVEIEAEGDKEALDRFLSELQSGPNFARVDNIDMTWLNEEPQHKEFRVRY
jgi:acylphosphatase